MLSYLTLLFIGGASLLSLPVLISSTVKWHHTPPPAYFAGLILVRFLSAEEQYRRVSPLTFMQGYLYLDHHNWLVLSPFPWLQLVLTVTVSVALMILSIIAIQRQDF